MQSRTSFKLLVVRWVAYFFRYLFISQFSALRWHTNVISYDFNSSLLTFLKRLLCENFASFTWSIYVYWFVLSFTLLWYFLKEDPKCYAFYKYIYMKRCSDAMSLKLIFPSSRNNSLSSEIIRTFSKSLAFLLKVICWYTFHSSSVIWYLIVL